MVTTDDGLRAILRELKTVAVLGAKAQASQAAYYVPAYLAAHGYRIVPVNPTLAGRTLFGLCVAPTLADLDEPTDVVEVFRRSEHLPTHAREILALPWRPQAVWFQLGIRNDSAAELLARSGIRVVQDRCMMPEHRRLVVGG
ncbi:MAG: CoA-binding protein [Candidatus Rokuibacteriota bacterium]